jgi:hypothetical protein
MAPPTIKSPTIIITTELENPANASPGLRIPSKTNDNKEHKATISERIFPHTKKTAVTNRIARVRTMGEDIV